MTSSPPPTDVVASATALVIAGRNQGTGVRVDRRHLLTARHVVVSSNGDVLSPITVTFLAPASDGEPPPPYDGQVVDLGAAVDIAVIRLTRPPAGQPLVPALAGPGHTDQVRMLGYPTIEVRDGLAQRKGVWSEFTVAGRLPTGHVQLNWSGQVRAGHGHSGGPVVTADTGGLVGIFIEGSKHGGFDRFVPLDLIRRVWPGMPRPWLFAGADDAKVHFRMAARGQHRAVERANLFRGRDPALKAVRDWLTATEPPGRPCVITGQPGAGKSSVLCRAALAVANKRGGGLAFYARGSTTIEFADAIADQLWLPRRSTKDELLRQLANRAEGRPMVIAVDAVDEAADVGGITEMIKQLAELSWIRIAVATRALADGKAGTISQHLRALGVTGGADSPNLVDLDSDRYFDAVGMRKAIITRLTRKDSEPAHGGAWRTYRKDTQLRRRLSGAVAHRAGRNHLVAALVATQLAEEPGVVDPAAADFSATALPSTVSDAVARYLKGLDEDQRWRVRGLLVALAYARAAGLDEDQWLTFASALEFNSTRRDRELIRTSSIGDLLSCTGNRFRLFHQAFVDALRADRNAEDDERRVYHAVRADAVRSGWPDASDYARDQIAGHAAAAGLLDELISDADFLVHTKPDTLLEALRHTRTEKGAVIRAVYRASSHRLRTLDSAGRRSLLAIDAARFSARDLLGWLRTGLPLPPRWATNSQVTHALRASLDGNRDAVYAVTVATPAGGRPIVLAAGVDRAVRRWHLDDCGQAPELGRTNTDPIRALACALRGKRLVVLSGGDDDRVRISDAETGERLDSFAGHQDRVRAVAVLSADAADAEPTVVSADDDGTVRAWRVSGLTEIGRADLGQTVYTVAVPSSGGGPIVAGCADGIIRVWPSADLGERVVELRDHRGPVRAVAMAADAGTRLVSAGDDATIRIWDLAEEALLAKIPAGSAVLSIALGQHGGQPIVVAGCADGRIRVWGLPRRNPREVFTGHDGPVHAIALADGEDGVLISGGEDGAVRVWNLGVNRRVAPVGHSARVRSVASVADSEAADGHLALTAAGGPMLAWNVHDGRPVLAGLPAVAVAGTVVAGRPVAVVGDGAGALRVWDLRENEGRAETSLGAAVTALACTPEGLAVVGDAEGEVRVWDVAGQSPPVLIGRHDHPVTAVACCVRYETVFAVSVSEGGSGRVWNVTTGASQSWLRGHVGAVRVVACAELGGVPVVVTAGDDGTVRCWNPLSGVQRGGQLIHHRHDEPVWAVVCTSIADRPVVVSGGDDAVLRVWYLDTPWGSDSTPAYRVVCPYPVRALGGVPGGLVVGTGHEVVLLEHPIWSEVRQAWTIPPW